MGSNYPNSNPSSAHSRVYGYDQKPAKYDLIREQPRRDSRLDEQLTMNMNPLQFSAQQQNATTITTTTTTSRSQQQNEPINRTTQVSSSYQYGQSIPEIPERRYYGNNMNTSQSSTQAGGANDYGLPQLNSLTNELARKEAKLRREIAYMNTYKNQFVPKSPRETRKEPNKTKSVWHKEVPASPVGSRPTSRASASSHRSATTEADVLEKAAKLLEDAEEMERKEIIDEPVILDSKGAPKPAGSASPASTLNRRGVKSAIINVPNRDIDNKSPLPFSYDNFSTLGVRGNIASVGAAQPDKPYPPIFPQIKRTQSPLV